VQLIHVSADYVFDGSKGTHYVKIDPAAPQGVYDTSVLVSEQAVLSGPARSMVLRTSWVYSLLTKVSSAPC
jgi:dTDP-4-dehydrorhamnose reductase